MPGIVGVGIDLVDIERFRTSLERTPSMRERMFTPGERAYAETANDPTERYAARFAAKEAVLKALGAGLGACPMRDIEVVRAGSGAPSLALHGKAAALAAERGVAAWHVSLTHTPTMAEAVVVALAD